MMTEKYYTTFEKKNLMLCLNVTDWKTQGSIILAAFDKVYWKRGTQMKLTTSSVFW